MLNKKYTLFVIACTMFGSTFLAISLGLQAGASPLFYAAIRFTTAGCIMLTAILISGRADLRAIKSLALRGSLYSVLMTAGTFGTMFIAQTRIDSGFMARLDATGPLVTALMAMLFLGKRFSMAHLPAFILGTSGAFLIASPAVHAEPLYLAIAAGSVLLYATATVFYPLIFSQDDDPILISAIQSFTGGLILMGIAFATETVRFPSAALGPLLYLIFGGSIIGHTATFILVRDAGAVFASGWLYVAPVIATILGILILNEPVTISGIIGTILALSGVFILGWAERSPAPETGTRETISSV